MATDTWAARAVRELMRRLRGEIGQERRKVRRLVKVLEQRAARERQP